MSVAGGLGTKVPCPGEGLGMYPTYHVNVTYLMMHVITYPTWTDTPVKTLPSRNFVYCNHSETWWNYFIQQECIPVGCVTSAAVSAGGGLPGRGGLPHSPPAKCWDTPPVQCMLGYTHPPWTKFLTHVCENITFPQLLSRTVITSMFLLWIKISPTFNGC